MMHLRCSVVVGDALVFSCHIMIVGAISPGNSIEQRIVAVVLLSCEAQLAVRFKKHIGFKLKALLLFKDFLINYTETPNQATLLNLT